MLDAGWLLQQKQVRASVMQGPGSWAGGPALAAVVPQHSHSAQLLGTCCCQGPMSCLASLQLLPAQLYPAPLTAASQLPPAQHLKHTTAPEDCSCQGGHSWLPPALPKLLLRWLRQASAADSSNWACNTLSPVSCTCSAPSSSSAICFSAASSRASVTYRGVCSLRRTRSPADSPPVR